MSPGFRWSLAFGVGVMLLAGVCFGQQGDESLGKRASEALANGQLSPAEQGPLLAGYADSLRTIDAVLAARCLERSGIAAFRQSNLDTALERWQRGLRWARGVHPATEDSRQTESSLLNALAIGHTAGGDVEAALPVYDQAIKLRTAMQDTLGLSRTWGNLATGYANIGRTAEALAATTEESRWLEFVDNKRGTVANALRPVVLLTSMGRLDEALWQSEQALAVADSIGGLDERAMATMYRGNALLDSGLYTDALPVLLTAEDLMIQSGDDYSLNFVRQSIVQCLLFLQRNEEALHRVREAIPAVEAAGLDPVLTVLLRYEAHALFALERRMEAEVRLQRALELFENRRMKLEDERSQSGIFQASGEIYAALARCQLAENKIEEAFLTVERGRAKIFRDQTGHEMAAMADLQAHLMASESALILFNDPGIDPLVAFILDGRNLTVVELGNWRPMAVDARAALRLLAAGQSLESCRPALERLEKSLSIPLLKRIDSRVKRFAVVPPAFLTGFPFGILRDAEGRQWGEERPLNYLPNASALIGLDAREAPSSGVLAFADPTTSDQAPGYLPPSSARARAGVPLPQSRTEILSLTRTDNERRVGLQATGAELRRAMTVPVAVLHLATHAEVDPVDGGRSAVVLAGEGGMDAVTAEEIADYDFRGDLVVLSGCSTFGGHRVLGEGWFGLPRSFLSAGARTVVSTLWDVDDLGARRFMTEYYNALAGGSPRDLALVQARRVCREAGLPPREWAAFVLTGVGDDGVPLMAAKGEGGKSPLWGLMLGLLLLMGLVFWWRRPRPSN